MGKIRVHKLAAELGMSNSELTNELISLGYPVKNHMSAVDIDEVIKIRETILAKAREEDQKKEAEAAEKESESVSEEKKQEPIEQVEETEENGEPLEIIEVYENIALKDFAAKIKCPPNELIKAFIKEGLMATINHPIDDTSIKVAENIFHKKIKVIPIEQEETIDEETEKGNIDDYVLRPPVVTIMGHVDHGKTTLLDAIRNSNITEKEAGGITQHIGAYLVSHEKGKVSFLDTPGHEAFTAMRARGAKVTDIVVLVVAADDGLMPQTIEAIHHARAGNVPIVVAINKVDKPGANADKIKKDLTAHDLVPEEWGGQTIFVEVSALKQTGIDNLMEMILLQTEVLELKGNPKLKGRGTIIESRLDKGRGPVATVMVQQGVMKTTDSFVAGATYGKIRALINDKGKKIKTAEISMPVEIIGLSSVPVAGDPFVVVSNEKKARQIATVRQQKLKERSLKQAVSRITLEDLRKQIDEGKIEELNVVIKADVDGSVQAILDSLLKIGSEEVRIKMIHGSVGGITESDVLLAAASNAVIIGFNIRPTEKAAELAENEQVDIKLYSVIYNVIDDVKAALEGMLKPDLIEKRLGRAEVREVISVPKVGFVCGCYVLDGDMKRNSEARLVRDSIVIYEGKISSLRRFKDDVKEVSSGFECGITLENYQDIKQGDIIEPYYFEEVARTL